MSVLNFDTSICDFVLPMVSAKEETSFRAIHDTRLARGAGLQGREEVGEKDAGSGQVGVGHVMVGVVVTPLRGEAGGVARGLVGNIGVETDQILPNVTLNIAAAQLGPVHLHNFVINVNQFTIFPC